jgi:AcrR family transcriptional regulator
MSKAVAIRDAERTQADLLAVATEEFARDGFFGARVDKIAARSKTTKRMIYYYFGDKRGLYTAVLEKAYGDIRATEQSLELSGMPPGEAMARLIRHTIEYHDAHPHLARLVTVENGMGAENLRQSRRQADLNLPIVVLVEDILERGRASGEFVRDVRAVDLHLLMSALALFRITNAPTILATFGIDMGTQESKAHATEFLVSLVLTWLRHAD